MPHVLPSPTSAPARESVRARESAVEEPRTSLHWKQLAFWTWPLVLVLGALSPAAALLLGLAYALVLGNPLPALTAKLQRSLLQASIIGLGFGVNFHALVATGTSGAGITALTLLLTLGLGLLLARALRVERTTGTLISIGTAICGGSAIAAMGPVLGADDRQMSISLGCVFLLNAVALFAFPLAGHWAHLTPQAFGWWAAVAIHDTSSVAGAAAKYGAAALAVAIPVKLARALWIVPFALVVATATKRSDAKPKFPWFILGFVAASVLATFVAAPRSWAALLAAAKFGLSATLFLIGAGLTVTALRQVGCRPFLQALALWLAISTVSLAVISLWPSAS